MLPRHVYIHVPFCARRCSYCDFAIAVRRIVPVDEYLRALRTELELRFPDRDGWRADTLYFGGGTPSQLGGVGMARALELIRAYLALNDDTEVTIEANPDDVTPDAARLWRANGINRLSLGGQSFDASVLAWMHRTHSADQISRAVRTARDAGFQNISLDLIFAVPESLDRDWEADLTRALALKTEHLSLYGLTVHDATPLARWRDSGTTTEAPEERFEEQFLRAHDVLERAGYDHYEVSSYARPEFQSRHNAGYWNHEPYAGLGPSAHEFDGVRRRWNTRSYADWVRRLASGEDPLAGDEILTEENRAAERVYLGLRIRTGIVLNEDERTIVTRWVQAGWATLDESRLRLTPLGWLRVDSLALALAEYPSHC